MVPLFPDIKASKSMIYLSGLMLRCMDTQYLDFGYPGSINWGTIVIYLLLLRLTFLCYFPVTNENWWSTNVNECFPKMIMFQFMWSRPNVIKPKHTILKHQKACFNKRTTCYLDCFDIRTFLHLDTKSCQHMFRNLDNQNPDLWVSGYQVWLDIKTPVIGGLLYNYSKQSLR